MRPTNDRQGTRFAARAIRQGWDIPPEKRDAVVAMLCSVALDEKAKTRTRVQAARALVTASAVNASNKRTGVLAAGVALARHSIDPDVTEAARIAAMELLAPDRMAIGHEDETTPTED